MCRSLAKGGKGDEPTPRTALDLAVCTSLDSTLPSERFLLVQKDITPLQWKDFLGRPPNMAAIL